jgi:hypothetical protein
MTEVKVLARVGAFFLAPTWLIIRRMAAALNVKRIVRDRSVNVARFDFKIEHVNNPPE